MLLWLLVTQSVPKCSKQFFKVAFIISCSNFDYPVYVLDSFSQKALHICLATRVLYMCSSLWLLGVESCDFSQAEIERTASKAEQIHKMTTIFTQNGPRLSF